jgi:SAM-dependent methyltransferase
MNETEAVRRDLAAIGGMPRYYGWKAALVGPHLGERVIEAGCGNGLLLERLGGRSLLAGVERDAGCAREAAGRLAGRADIRCLDILSPDFLSMAELKPDTVLFVNALEAIPDDRSALRQARAVLVPGGRVVVFASAMPSLAGELDSAFGQRRYGKAGLRKLVEEGGFRVTRLGYANLLGALGWWLDSRLMKRREMTAADYRRRDALVPLARLVDALTGPPFGRSLLVVGVKE